MAMQTLVAHPRLTAGARLLAAWPSQVFAVSAGTLLLALSARVQVPFWPVPATLQTLVVLVLAAVLGGRLAAATVAAYLVEGLVGRPVFAGAASGPAYFAGPTGGYLAGFLAAAGTVGALADRGAIRTLPGTVSTLLAGTVLIYLCGLTWLSTWIGPERAIGAGLLPFLPAEAAKLALAVALLAAMRRLPAGPLSRAG